MIDGIRASLATSIDEDETALDVLVCDNGSVDRTRDVAEECGARVVEEERRGYGAACLRGLASIENEDGIIVYADADGSDEFDPSAEWSSFAQDDFSDFGMYVCP